MKIPDSDRNCRNYGNSESQQLPIGFPSAIRVASPVRTYPRSSYHLAQKKQEELISQRKQKRDKVIILQSWSKGRGHLASRNISTELGTLQKTYKDYNLSNNLHRSRRTLQNIALYQLLLVLNLYPKNKPVVFTHNIYA